jgi:peroxiredoxin
MTIKVGDKLPQANLMTTTADGIEPVTSEDFFKGKHVGLFAVPGAFTPTCSAKHMPGFKAHLAELKAKGLDTIACVSVNDAFVMKAWAKDQGVDGEIVMLADGNGDFTKALGLELDGSRFGLGSRSLRYSLVANDGVVEQLHIEQGGEFKVSSAEYLLEHL